MESHYENLYGTLDSRLTALHGQIQALRDATVGKFADLTDSLEDFTIAVANDIRGQLGNEKFHQYKNTIINGEEVIKTTIDNIKKNNKVERAISSIIDLTDTNLFGTQETPNKPQYEYNWNQRKLTLYLNNVDVTNFDLQTSSIDNINKKTLNSVKNFDSVSGFTTDRQLDTQIIENINILDFIYILKSRKISGNDDNDLQDKTHVDTLCNIIVGYMAFQCDYLDEINITPVDNSDNPNYDIQLIFIATKANLRETEMRDTIAKIIPSQYIKKNFEFNTSEPTDIETNLGFQYFYYQGDNNTIINSIIKSDYNIIYSEFLLFFDENDTIFNHLGIGQSTSISSNDLIPKFSNNNTTNLQTIYDNINNSTTGLNIFEKEYIKNIVDTDTSSNDYNVTKNKLFLMALFCHLYNVTIDFDINNYEFNNIQLNVLKGGKIEIELTDNTLTVLGLQEQIHINKCIKFNNSDTNDTTQIQIESTNIFTNRKYYILDSPIITESTSGIFTIELILTSTKYGKTSLVTSNLESESDQYSINVLDDPIVEVSKQDILYFINYKLNNSQDNELNFDNNLYKYLKIEIDEQQ